MTILGREGLGKKAILRFAFILSVTSILGGCAFIDYPQGGGVQGVSSASTGEAWYVKNRYFLSFLTSSDVYYCDGKGVCKKASMK